MRWGAWPAKGNREGGHTLFQRPSPVPIPHNASTPPHPPQVRYGKTDEQRGRGGERGGDRGGYDRGDGGYDRGGGGGGGYGGGGGGLGAAGLPGMAALGGMAGLGGMGGMGGMGMMMGNQLVQLVPVQLPNGQARTAAGGCLAWGRSGPVTQQLCSTESSGCSLRRRECAAQPCPVSSIFQPCCR